MSINFQIVKSNINLDLLQVIEKRVLEQFKTVGYDSSNWPTMAKDTLLHYSNNQLLWIAVSENTALGFAVVDIYETYAHLEELDVDPAFQRNGIASALVMEVINWAKKLGIKAITLRTFRTTAWSVELYKKFNFEITHDNIKHIPQMIANEARIGLQVSDRITMILIL